MVKDLSLDPYLPTISITYNLYANVKVKVKVNVKVKINVIVLIQ